MCLLKGRSDSLQSRRRLKAIRPKYDPELLVGFERKWHDARLLRKFYAGFDSPAKRPSVQDALKELTAL